LFISFRSFSFTSSLSNFGLAAARFMRVHDQSEQESLMKLSQSIVGTVALVSVAFAGNAFGAMKMIQNTNFNTGYIAGTVTTAAQYTAGTAGQGGWFTAGGGSTFYNIASDPTVGGTKGLGMSIQGSNTGTARYAWTDNVYNNWGSRDVGSDTIYAVWDQDTTTTNTSKNKFGAVIYDASGSKILAGMYVDAATGALTALSYSTSGTTGNFGYSTGVTINRNAWQSLAMTFNKTTGVSGYYWKVSGTWAGATIAGAAAGVNPDEFDLYQSANSSTTQGLAYYDNILISSGSGSFVPAPGAVALIGLAGLVARRRR
jgi:MYXO-CTERM domain-containing protein